MTGNSLTDSDRKELSRQVRERLIKNHKSLFSDPESNAQLNQQEEAIRQETRELLGREDSEIEEYVVDQLIGYKDLGPYFRDPAVTDILVNGPDQVYIEKNNRLILTDIKFESNDEVMKILQIAVQRAGRKVDFNHPLVDVQLPGGSRLNAVVVPNCPFPSISIRKFIRHKFSGEDLLKQNYLSEEMLEFFRYAVRGGCNIVISGAAGSGKTTFLRFLCGFIPPDERIVTVEDTFELNLEGHVVPLQGSKKVSIEELMKNTLRMNPKRIILGEFRGAETFELLQAMGTGHMGSMTTGHANNGRQDLLQRLIRAMIHSGLSDDELTRQITSAIDLTVFIKKYRDGRWCITEVNEVLDNKGRPEFREIFRYNRAAGRHEAVNSLSAPLVERIQDEIGTDRLPEIKAFARGPKARSVVVIERNSANDA